MYTCDLCGQDVLSPENLEHVNHGNGEGKKFYGTFDLCICYDCFEKHCDNDIAHNLEVPTFVLAEGEE